jgi:hypothetical protein
VGDDASEGTVAEEEWVRWRWKGKEGRYLKKTDSGGGIIGELVGKLRAIQHRITGRLKSMNVDGVLSNQIPFLMSIMSFTLTNLHDTT